MLLKLVTIEFL